jgi:hypothetical protein
MLVSVHPDYSLEIDGKDILVKHKSMVIVDNFPEKNGWYLTDAMTGIPTGQQVNSNNPNARYLVRVDGAGRIGPVARGYVSTNYINKRYAYLYLRPSGALGVAVEAPEGSAKSVFDTTINLTKERGGGKLLVEGTTKQIDFIIAKIIETFGESAKTKE